MENTKMRTLSKQDIRIAIARILARESRQSSLKARLYGEQASRLIRKVYIIDRS